jgi:branched-chain amino acid transport system substrate-binding protein
LLDCVVAAITIVVTGLDPVIHLRTKAYCEDGWMPGAFGRSLKADATVAVKAAGGKVLGSVRHSLSTSDFSGYLLQAQASGAKVVAFANSGGDMINAVKQANEFGLTKNQTMVSLLVFISDVHSMELQAAQG